MLKMNIFKDLKVVSGLLAIALLGGCAATGAGADAHTFFRSAQLDDTRTMGRLLAGGIDPNLAEPVRGDSGMILALREDANKVFMLLLAQPGSHLEATSGNGDTALMLASYKHNMAAVVALLARGAQVNRPNWSALHYAAASGDEPILRVLLEHGAAIDARSPGKVTPLMMAAREGHPGAVRRLLKAGADAGLKSSDGMSALQFAQNADQNLIADVIVAHLKAKGANLRQHQP
ncbi:MAG: ankyrin repeat protein [Janthinobacterium sp.]|jgi:ankyrin repeat protein